MKTRSQSGFTLMELMVSTALMVFVAAAIVTFYILLQNIWYRCNMAMVTSLKGCATLNRIVYGKSIANPGIRSGSGTYAWDWTDGSSYILYYATNRSIAYDAASQQITDESGNLLCKYVTSFTGSLVNGGVKLDIALGQTVGRHSVTSSMRTFVEFRN